jgi:List-Bact-rpt repeat protein
MSATSEPRTASRSHGIRFTFAAVAAVAVLATWAASASAFSVGDSTVTTTIQGYGTVTVTSGATPNPTCTSPSSTPQSSTYSGCPAVDGSAHETSGSCTGDICTWDVVLHATAPSGWQFAGWSGDCSGTGDCQRAVESRDCSDLPCAIDYTPASVGARFTDDRAPTTSFTASPASLVYSDTQSQAFSFHTDEDTEAPTFACRREPTGTFVSCSSGFTWSSIPDGLHQFCVRGTDASGLQGGAICTSWEQERNPTATILTHPVSTTGNPEAAFTYTSNKSSHPSDGSTLSYLCKLDAAPFGACPASGASYSMLGNGVHTFQVEAVFHGAFDGIGVTHTSPSEGYTWTQADTTGPSITVTDAPPAETTSDQATVSWTGSEPGEAQTFQCKLDNSPTGFQPCSSPLPMAGLSAGAHDLYVQGKDFLGNTGPAADVHWTVVGPPSSAQPSSDVKPRCKKGRKRKHGKCVKKRKRKKK